MKFVFRSTLTNKVYKVEEQRVELNKKDQEILAMGAKMKTLEEQHQDYQRHIAVLKESLCAKEEHYNMLQSDVRIIYSVICIICKSSELLKFTGISWRFLFKMEELRARLDEKNKLIEKKTQHHLATSHDRNKINQELQELRDHLDIRDRKISVLQRKVITGNCGSPV